MGGGTWTSAVFSDYVTTSRGISADEYTTMNCTAQNMYKSRRLDKALDPLDVMRECRDTEEHPNTVPVILALDVTGSMGGASVRVAQKLNQIMTDLYSDEDIKDIEFCIMGIGDLAYDKAPIQISQFESDIRIAEQLDKLYFESGGGGNNFESYTAAWYMGVNHCKLDCWNRGKKGIIITLGDEFPNPYLPSNIGSYTQGYHLQDDIETSVLLKEAKEKFNLYHISINDKHSSYNRINKNNNMDNAWIELLGESNYFVGTLDNLSNIIVDIIKNNSKDNVAFNEVVW